MKMLPIKWQEFLAKKSETGMGYQVVNLTLHDGRKVEDVAIIQSSLIDEIRGGDIQFDPEKSSRLK